MQPVMPASGLMEPWLQTNFQPVTLALSAKDREAL